MGETLSMFREIEANLAGNMAFRLIYELGTIITIGLFLFCMVFYLCKRMEPADACKIGSETDVIIAEEVFFQDIFKACGKAALFLAIYHGVSDWIAGLGFWGSPYWMEYAIFAFGFFLASRVMYWYAFDLAFTEAEAMESLLNNMFLFLRTKLGDHDGREILHSICAVLNSDLASWEAARKLMDYSALLSGTPAEKGRLTLAAYLSLIQDGCISWQGMSRYDQECHAVLQTLVHPLSV